MLARAHGEADEQQRAREELLQCYGGAVRRYLVAALRNEEAADEVFQEFSLRMVRGDFKKATPEKGRFRAYLKTCLHHLMMDHHRQIQRKPKSLGDKASGIANPIGQTDEWLDRSFIDSWRRGILDETWNRLQLLSEQSEQPYFQVLRTRADFPEDSLQSLGERLARLGLGSFEGSKLRVTLHRARKRFAALLTDQIRETLEYPTEEAIEEELIALGLRHLVR